MSVISEQDSPSSDGGALERTVEIKLPSSSVEETWRLGAMLGGLLAPGDVVLLEGDLGTGKTAFTQGIGLGLGVASTINSPTFTLLKEYSAGTPLYHFDLYRIDQAEEFAMLGFDDYLGGDGVCVVEWAERAEVTLENEPGTADGPWPVAGYVRVHLYRRGENERTLACAGEGERGRAVLAAFAQVAAMNGVK